MKYAKKMKLVEIDDDCPQPSNQTLPSDDSFTAPRMLSILDNSMNEILNRHDMDDSEKWILYNQTLQKFLSYMKKKRTPTPQHTPQEQRNHSIDLFDGNISEQNISGIMPLRDSIESISHPSVRAFFKQVRDNMPDGFNTNHSSPATSTSSIQSLSPNLDISHTPPQSQINQSVEMMSIPNNITHRRRAPKRNAAHDVSGVPPTKILPRNPTPRALFRPRNPAGHRHDFYWEPTNAK